MMWLCCFQISAFQISISRKQKDIGKSLKKKIIHEKKKIKGEIEGKRGGGCREVGRMGRSGTDGEWPPHPLHPSTFGAMRGSIHPGQTIHGYSCPNSKSLIPAP